MNSPCPLKIISPVNEDHLTISNLFCQVQRVQSTGDVNMRSDNSGLSHPDR